MIAEEKTLDMLAMLDELDISIDDLSYQNQLAIYMPETYAGTYLRASLACQVLIKTIKDQLKNDFNYILYGDPDDRISY